MRFVIAAGAGLSAAMLLFLLMHTLISGEQEFESADLTSGMVDFIRIREDEITQLKERTPPQEPEPPEEPPPPPQLQVTAQTDQAPAAVLDIEMPLVSVPVSTGGGPFIGQWPVYRSVEPRRCGVGGRRHTNRADRPSVAA